MQGAVQSCITCGVQYAIHQSTQKSFGDALEMHWKSMEFNTQGHTLTSHIPGSHPCLRPCPHQSRVSSPPKVSSSPSMICDHDHTFAAAWRVVGGCCFYEWKGPLARSWGEC